MIQETVTTKGTRAITSDQWHVVHSRFSGAQQEWLFARGIHSEHEDFAHCKEAARALRDMLKSQHPRLPAAERDEVFIRRPHYKTLLRSKSRRAKPSAN